MLLISCLCICNGCKNKTAKMEERLVKIIEKHDAELVPIATKYAIAYWDASISGSDKDYASVEELSKAMVAYYSDKNIFAQLKEIKESEAVKDDLLKRQLDILYHSYLVNQADPKKLNRSIELQTEIDKKFSKYRAILGTDTLTDNDVERELKTVRDSKRLEAVWKAHKGIGAFVSADIIALVKLRNEIAKEAGYDNFHQMSLMISDQNPDEILQLFDELDDLTKNTFVELKKEMDTKFASLYDVKEEELMPWHYQNRFFQEAPELYPINFDVYYKNQNIEKLTSDFFDGLNLNIDDMLANSDLYEKEGKNQHAYCISIDKKGDVRVLCNLKNTETWMGTMLHEYGHAIYEKKIDRNLPYLLRDPANVFTTEAIAMLFGRNSTNVNWMKAMNIIDEKQYAEVGDKGFLTLRLQQMVFSRWSQVMFRFEKEMYANPDQDLNALWWSLVEKYQLLQKPADWNAADWASKIHIAAYPCYYHNYHLGELFASQLNHYICSNILNTEDVRTPNYVGNAKIGEYLEQNVFAPGAKLRWNEMIEKACGEKLSAKYYAEQFLKGSSNN